MKDFFKLKEVNSSYRVEILGGITTFLTMAYIIFVNPSILTTAVVPDLSMADPTYQQYFGAFMVATIVSAATATLVMGLWANYPFALAPGMGLNAYFTYTVCLKMGISWRLALAAIFVEGLIFIFITSIGLRAFIVKSFPRPVKTATAAGIGLFLAFIGLKNAGIVVADPATFVSLGDLSSGKVLTCLVGLVITAALFARKVSGSILIGILAATIVGIFTGETHFQGIVGSIPDISPVFLKLDLSFSMLLQGSFWIVVMTFFFADFFDTAGTITGLGRSSGLSDKEGNLPRDKQAYLADAIGTTVGALFGSSTVTSYIESGAGMAQGARTGLAAVTVATLMLLSLFFAPLAMSIPAAATAPALIFIGALMMKEIKNINWEESTEAFPAFITVLTMPLTFSIANGIALGMILYPFLKLFAGKLKEVHWMNWILAFAFILYFLQH